MSSILQKTVWKLAFRVQSVRPINQNSIRKHMLCGIHYKFPKCYIFLDKAAPYYKSQKVRQYFEKHKDSLMPLWLPTASPEFMVLEECWNISKNDLLALSYYPSFTDFRNRIAVYFRTKRFNLNMRNYLIGNVSA